MSELEDTLWAIQRQSRALQDVLADARLVWRDANARAAEQRFLQPRAEAEGTVITSVGAQHISLNAAAEDVMRADEHHRTAAEQSALVSQLCEQCRQNAQSAFTEANSANTQAQMADALAAEARVLIAQAAAAGS